MTCRKKDIYNPNLDILSSTVLLHTDICSSSPVLAGNMSVSPSVVRLGDLLRVSLEFLL